jgi:hypothetical protein
MMTGSTPDELSDEVERRLTAIGNRFPNRFSPEQVEEIRNRVRKSVEQGVKLTEQHLANGVGPDFDPRAMSHDE